MHGLWATPADARHAGEIVKRLVVVARGSTGGRVGVEACLFIKMERAREAIVSCELVLLDLHLHDFADTDHYPPFDGNIQWGEIFSALQDIGYTGEFMFEAVARISLADTLHKTAAFPGEFAARYGDPFLPNEV